MPLTPGPLTPSDRAPSPIPHAAPTDPPPTNHHLRRQLGLRDLVLTQILCVVGSSWVGVAAGLGRAQTLTWIAAMLLFYLPMAASVIYLNRAMPLEGGLYVWASRAFGDFVGFLTAWNLWIYGIAVTATILYAIPTEIAYLFGPSAAWLPEDHLASAAIVFLILALVTVAALRGLEIGKWIHNIGGIAMLLVFVVLILLPLASGLLPSLRASLSHHPPSPWAPFTLHLPPLNLRSFALFGQMLVGALCGLEYIAILAGESRHPARAIAQSVWISSPVICAMFILGTASVVAFTTPGHIDFIAPIPQTLRLALGNSGAGSLFAAAAIFLLQLRLLGASSYLFTGVTRLPMAAGWDHLVPAWFSHLHPRHRTPTHSIAFTAALVALLILLAGVGVHAQEAFQVLSNASITHYSIAYLVMFAIPLLGAAGLRDTLPLGLKVLAAAGLCATAFSLAISAYPIVDVVNARAYAAKVLGTTLASNLLATLFYKLRTRPSITPAPNKADT